MKLTPFAIFAAVTGACGIFHIAIFLALGTYVLARSGQFVSFYLFALIGACELVFAVIVAKRYKLAGNDRDMIALEKFQFSQRPIRLWFFAIMVVSSLILGLLFTNMPTIAISFNQAPAMGASFWWFNDGPPQLLAFCLIAHIAVTALGIFILNLIVIQKWYKQ